MEAQQLERLFKANRRDTLSDITLKFNENNVNPVAKRTLLYHLHAKRPEKKIGDKRSQQKKRRCQEKQRWSVENNWKRNWKRIIFSEESKIMIGHDEQVYVWRKTGEGWRPDLVMKDPGPSLKL